jgi:agmatinase
MASFREMFGGSKVETFFGLPKAAPGETAAAVQIIAAATATPYANVGAYCAAAPAALRDASGDYAPNFGHWNFDLGGPVLPDGVQAVDCGDIAIDPADAPGNRDRISQAVRAILAAGGVPVLIGGDDSVPLPLLAALDGQGPVSILQIDAHIDWRDDVQGEAMGLSSTMRRAQEMGHIGAIVQVGQRGIGSARAQDVADAVAAGVTFVPASEVQRDGIARALAALPQGVPVAICLDLDALDPAIMPGVIGRTAGGLSYDQVLQLILGAAERGPIAAFDMVEFMPERDLDGIGALNGAQLLAAVIGVIARQQS